MKDLVLHIAKSLAENPDAVSVSQKEEEEGVIRMELTVAPEDMGKVIGKQGRIAKAIRSVLKAASAKENKKYYLDIG